MKLAVVTLVVCFSPSFLMAGESLPRSTPEAQGVSSAGVLEFVQAAEQLESLHSVMLVRHGHVVAEGWWAPYCPGSRHSLYSLSKSFTSTAIGLAVAEGKLSLDDEVLKFFPEEAPKVPSDNLKQMRIHDLLRMSAGHQKEVDFWTNPHLTKTFLEHPVPFKPGTHFMYNTPASYMLSAILQKVNGETTHDYLRPRLFDPLGIEDTQWQESDEGVTQGGFGLSIRTEDIAKFGQLYLQKGEWQGRQLIPADWVHEATSRQTSNGSNPQSDWDQGYGYQFWRCRHNGFRGDGAFGQFCVVMPEQDAVVAITSGVGDMQQVLNLVWDKLLPALNEGALKEDEQAHEKLTEKLAGLSLKPQTGDESVTPSANILGKTFVFPENDLKLESVSLTGKDDGKATLHLTFKGEDQQAIDIADGKWQEGHIDFPKFDDQPVAASGGWTSADTFKARLCLYETPFTVTLTLKKDGEGLSYESQFNLGFGDTKKGPFVGQSQ